MEQFEGFHVWLWGKFMFDEKKMSKAIGLLTFTLFFCSQAYPQRQSQGSAAQGSGTESAARVPLHSPDIISDNLDRVAASADQIPEPATKQAGFMSQPTRLPPHHPTL